MKFYASISLETITFIVFFFVCETLSAQGGYDQWFFSQQTNYGLSFSPNGSVAVTSTHATPFAEEGSVVVVDPIIGNLLFYSNGNVVWDGNHNVMPNGVGLLANPSVSEKCETIQIPGECGRFMMFHSTAVAENNGNGSLYYSIVDMNLPGNGSIASPLGDLDPTHKNVPVMSNPVEGLEIIKGPSDTVAWLFTGVVGSGNLELFKITVGGGIINQSTIPLGINYDDIRSLVFSYESSKLAVVSNQESKPVIIIDFDLYSGAVGAVNQVPGSITGPSSFYWTGFFDVEWSPSGRWLYLAKYRHGNLAGGIYQYDLLNPAVPITLQYSNPGGGSNNWVTDLKRTVNGEILFFDYQGSNGGTQMTLGEIQNADSSSPQYVASNLSFSQNFSPAHKFSNSLSSFPAPELNDDSVVLNCLSSVDTLFPFLNDDIVASIADFNFTVIQNFSSVIGTFSGDTLFVASNSSYSLDTLIYEVCTVGCSPFCDTAIIVVSDQGPSISLLQDTTILCKPDSIFIDTNGVSWDSLIWSDGSNGAAIFIDTAGSLEVKGYYGNCIVSDTISVFFAPSLMEPDTTSLIFCEGDSLLLFFELECDLCTYQWNTGVVSDTIYANTDGVYRFSFWNSCDSSYQDFEVFKRNQPPSIATVDTIVCPEDSVVFSPLSYSSDSSLTWAVNDTYIPSDTNLVLGDFFNEVRASNECGMNTFFINVSYLMEPLPSDSVIISCSDSLLFKFPEALVVFDSTGNHINSEIWIKENESITVSYLYCDSVRFFNLFKKSITEDISNAILSNVFTPNGDGINDFFHPVPLQFLSTSSLIGEFFIFNRWGSELFHSTSLKTPWEPNLDVPEGTYYCVVILGDSCSPGTQTRLVKSFQLFR